MNNFEGKKYTAKQLSDIHKTLTLARVCVVENNTGKKLLTNKHFCLVLRNGLRIRVSQGNWEPTLVFMWGRKKFAVKASEFERIYTLLCELSAGTKKSTSV